MFRQFGVTRVDGLDDLLEVSAALARTRPDAPPTWAKKQKQPGICVYAISGGTGAHMADMVAAAGLQIPDLTKKSQQALHDGLIPSYLRVSNPVDCGGPPVADSRGRKILDVILADDNVDIVVIPITGAVVTFSEPFTRDIIDVAKTSTKPDLRRVGCARRAPTTRTTSACSTAVCRCSARSTTASTRCARVPGLLDVRRALPLAVRHRADDAVAGGEEGAASSSPDLAPGEALSEWQSKQLLKAYGIKSSKDELVNSAAAAVRAANAIGFPVVMKVSSPDLLHKSDAGLVKVGVGSAKDVRAAYDELLAQGEEGRSASARIEGVLGREMVTGGVETLIGVSQDELFGPVVTVGLGGIFVEVFGDVTFRVPPFDEAEARARARSSSRATSCSQGVRGAEAGRHRRVRRHDHEGATAGDGPRR